MAIFCRLGRHEPLSGAVWNDGFYFSRCRRCRCEMIGRDGQWARVPRGYRVVWRPRTAEVPPPVAGLRPNPEPRAQRQASLDLSDYLVPAE